ncbi:RNA polymerase sigma factor sigV, partial [Dysosmobacter welbionis]
LDIVIVPIVVDIHRVLFPFRWVLRCGVGALPLFCSYRAMFPKRRHGCAFCPMYWDLFTALGAKRGGASYKGSAAIGTEFHNTDSFFQFDFQRNRCPSLNIGVDIMIITSKHPPVTRARLASSTAINTAKYTRKSYLPCWLYRLRWLCRRHRLLRWFPRCRVLCWL